MIVLPNSAIRYTCALRIYISLCILKYGLKPKHLEKLKKIYIAEAFLDKQSKQNLNIKNFVFNLLESVSAIKPHFKYSCISYGNYSINKNLLTVLLLNLSREINFIDIKTTNSHLIISIKGRTNKNSLSTVAALKGYFLYEIKNNQTLIIIPAPKTKQRSVQIESEWENLFNKFSVLNIFFTRIL